MDNAGFVLHSGSLGTLRSGIVGLTNLRLGIQASFAVHPSFDPPHPLFFFYTAPATHKVCETCQVIINLNEVKNGLFVAETV